jgi:histidinol-phosphate aminotransferase
MTDRRPLDVFRKDVQSMHAYAVQPSKGFIKLDTMENTHRLSPELQEELGRSLGAVAINRYPAEEQIALKEALIGHSGMPPDFDMVLGNGSDELISLLAMACDKPGATILAPLPGFVMYAMSAQLQGLNFVGVPLTPDFELDEPAMLAAIEQHKPAIVYIAYPNNPTANLWDEVVVDRIVQAAPGIVVIDEAYQPFASRSYMERAAQQSHVLVMRTMSKFGLAGVRIGYLVGPKAVVAEVEKLRPPFNVSVLNSHCAIFALEHAEVFAAQAMDIKAQRERLQHALREMPGLKTWPSDANMILVRVPDAARTFEGLKAHGVLVKNVSKMHPLLANCLRLTVGTNDENTQLLKGLQASL